MSPSPWWSLLFVLLGGLLTGGPSVYLGVRRLQNEKEVEDRRWRRQLEERRREESRQAIIEHFRCRDEFLRMGSAYTFDADDGKDVIMAEQRLATAAAAASTALAVVASTVPSEVYRLVAEDAETVNRCVEMLKHPDRPKGNPFWLPPTPLPLLEAVNHLASSDGGAAGEGHVAGTRGHERGTERR